MFDQLKNMAGMMGQMKEMKAKLEALQNELGDKTVEADAGAGAVRVVANGKFQILTIRIDKVMLATLVGEGDQADQQMIEDLIAGAVNAAITKAQQLVQMEMEKITGGMDLSGLSGLGNLLGRSGG